MHAAAEGAGDAKLLPNDCHAAEATGNYMARAREEESMLGQGLSA